MRMSERRYCTLKCEKSSKNHHNRPAKLRIVAVQRITPAAVNSPQGRTLILKISSLKLKFDIPDHAQ